MEFWTLMITMISAPNPKADTVKLVVSLSGDESDPRQLIPICEDPRWPYTFFFTVDKAVAPSFCLKFQIEKANSTCLEKDIGKVDLPVGDLFVMGSTGDVKPEALSYEVRSSSGETKGVLRFYCQLVPSQQVTSYPAAAAPPTSKSVAANPPQTHREPPPPSGYLQEPYPQQGPYPPQAGYPQEPYPPQAPYPPPPGAYLAWAYPPQVTYPPGGYPLQAGYPPWGYLAWAYPPQAAYPLGGYPPQPPYPPGGYGYLQAGYPPQAPYPPGGYPPQPPYPPGGYGYLQAGYSYPAPQPAGNQPAGYPPPKYGSGVGKPFTLALLGQLLGNGISEVLF